MSNTSGLFITTIKFRVLGQEKKFYKFMVEFNNVLQIHGSIMFSSKNNNWFISWPSESYEDKKTNARKYNNLVYIDNKSSKEAVENKILSSFNNGDPREFYSGDSTYDTRQQARKNNSGYQQNNQPPQPPQDSGSYGI